MKYGKYGKVKRLQGFLTRRVYREIPWTTDIGFDTLCLGESVFC